MALSCRVRAAYRPHTTMAPYFFRAFGLTVICDVPIPGLTPWSAGDPDVRLYAGCLPEWIGPTDETAREIWSAGGDPDHEADAVAVRAVGDGAFLLLAYGDGTRFVVSRSGHEVWASWPEGATLSAASTYLFGPVFGLLLRLRGLTCLHASVVVSGSGAVAVVGPAGAGKSTIAAAYALRGGHVIGDDIAVLTPSEGGWRVEPTVPSVRLWDDSVQLLLGNRDALPLMAPGWEKRQLDLTSVGRGFAASESVPLAAIYLLDARDARDAPGNNASPRRLSARDALMALVPNTYANVLLDASMRAAEFKVLTELVMRIPVWMISPPDGAVALEQLCALLERDGAVVQAAAHR